MNFYDVVGFCASQAKQVSFTERKFKPLYCQTFFCRVVMEFLRNVIGLFSQGVSGSAVATQEAAGTNVSGDLG